VALWSSRVAFEWRFWWASGVWTNKTPRPARKRHGYPNNATPDCVDTCSPSDGCDGGDPPPPHPVATGPDP